MEIFGWMLVGLGTSLWIAHFILWSASRDWATRYQHIKCGWIGDAITDACPGCGHSPVAFKTVIARPKYLGGWEIKDQEK